MQISKAKQSYYCFWVLVARKKNALKWKKNALKWNINS